MAVQTVFQRYEMKYLLTQAQREAVLRALEPHMALDPYGRTVIRNLYLDTESYRLIRRSIEKPVYKEKMRIRCYGPAHPDSPGCQYDEMTKTRVKLKDYVEAYKESDIHHLKDAGNKPKLMYLLREGRKWRE